ncbi:hypothetical protein Syun_029117 [Stephania yunnanensis]|uniref:Phytocyanin domain-containing protein n=1 Tax=Stephania yunnanensis TaxID=152371 RepID=A0AAP0ECM8_9MAGN
MQARVFKLTILIFEYHAHSHNVMQVNPSDFKLCNSTAPPLAVYTSGNDVVTFKMVGNYYFICGAPGHCEAGQKVEIKVVPSSPSSSMSGASRPALSPSALSPVPPHTSKDVLCQLCCFKAPCHWASWHCIVVISI